MTPRNYCTAAIDDLRRLVYYTHVPSTPEMRYGTQRVQEECARLLELAEKFLMPDWGRIFDADEFALLEDLSVTNRLPYPIVACEYFCDYEKYCELLPNEVPSSRRIALLVETEALEAHAPYVTGVLRRDELGFACIPISYLDTARAWGPPPAIAWFSRERRPQDLSCPIIVTPFGDSAYEQFSREQRVERASRDAHDECMCATHLIVALGMERTEATTIAPSAALNKKRERSGRPKFFEYRVLDIVADVMATPRERAGRPHGKHASPRMHKRRGHVRRLASGRATWVRNTIVGKPGRGEVEKDYRVHGHEEVAP